MRTYTTTHTVYTFDELNDAAKARAKEWYLQDDMRAMFLKDYIEEDAREVFPDSTLKCQFALGYCQGDGVNIFGTFYLPAILDRVRDKFTNKEYRRLRFYMSDGNDTIKTEPNRHYCYDNSFTIDFCENIEYCNDGLRDYDAETVEKFNSAIREYVGAFCSEWERRGYDYLYEIDDAEMSETCAANEWEFFENGDFAA